MLIVIINFRGLHAYSKSPALPQPYCQGEEHEAPSLLTHGYFAAQWLVLHLSASLYMCNFSFTFWGAREFFKKIDWKTTWKMKDLLDCNISLSAFLINVISSIDRGIHRKHYLSPWSDFCLQSFSSLNLMKGLRFLKNSPAPVGAWDNHFLLHDTVELHFTMPIESFVFSLMLACLI